MSLLWCVFFQTISICWIFGGKRVYDCIEQMVGFRINPYFYICWIAIAPAFMLVSSAFFRILQWSTFELGGFFLSVTVSLSSDMSIKGPLSQLRKGPMLARDREEEAAGNR